MFQTNIFVLSFILFLKFVKIEGSELFDSEFNATTENVLNSTIEDIEFNCPKVTNNSQSNHKLHSTRSISILEMP